jgi:hypothetical protein
MGFRAKESSFEPVKAGWPFAYAGLILSATTVGCFHDPDTSKLECQVDEQCPSDHWCTTTHKCATGKAPADSGVDASDHSDSSPVVEVGQWDSASNLLDTPARVVDATDEATLPFDVAVAVQPDSAIGPPTVDGPVSDSRIIDNSVIDPTDLPLPTLDGTAGSATDGDALRDTPSGAGGIVGSGGSGGLSSSGGLTGSGGTANGGSTGTGGTSVSIVVYPSASSLDLGAVVVGRTSDQLSITFTNVGQQQTGPITVTSNSDEFEIQNGKAGDCVSGVTALAPTISCTARLIFKPTITGPRSGLLAFNASPGGSGSLALTGTGVLAAQLSTGSITSLSFGTVLVGSSSAVQSFTMTNTGQETSGTITLAITNAAFVPQTGAFGDCISGSTNLPANTSCTMRLAFAPTTAGPATGSVSFTSTAGASGSVSLNGNGCQANACGGCGTLSGDPGTYCAAGGTTPMASLATEVPKRPGPFRMTC